MNRFERQRYRGKDGQYTETHRCELCGKGIQGEYWSDPRCDREPFRGAGLILHEGCHITLLRMQDGEAVTALDAARKAMKAKTEATA